MKVNRDGSLLQPSQNSSFWVLDNLYTFKAVGEDTNQAYALFELIVHPHNGTPPHIHCLEDEAFYIQEGEVEFQLEEQTIIASAGTFLYSPKDQLHSFKNIGSKPAKMLCWVTPAGLENFFAEVGFRVEDRKAPPPLVSPADIEKFLAAAPDYGIEFIPIGSNKVFPQLVNFLS